MELKQREDLLKDIVTMYSKINFCNGNVWKEGGEAKVVKSVVYLYKVNIESVENNISNLKENIENEKVFCHYLMCIYADFNVLYYCILDPICIAILFMNSKIEKYILK